MNLDNILVKAQISELHARIEYLHAEGIELNQRLSAQNRPNKQFADIIKAATIILSEHISGGGTGRDAIRRKYTYIGRRRWGWGVALLKMASIVVDSSHWSLTFNTNLTVTRAYEKLKSVASELSTEPQPTSKLRRFLPNWQQ